MQRSLALAFLVVWFVAPVRADMTLYFQEVGTDVALQLRGSIDTSVFAGFPSNATSTGTGFFTHSAYTSVTGGGSTGTGKRTTVISGVVAGDGFRFFNDAAMTSIGSPPPLKPGSHSINPAPPFWFGFLDVTQTSGSPGTIIDDVYLPDGYSSNELISFDCIAFNTSFAALGFARGDRWGVSFVNGTGGTQQIIFQAVPEPSTISLLCIGVIGLFGSRRQRRASS